jgi:hypothetical protein
LGSAVISLLLSSTLSCPSTSPLLCAHALTMTLLGAPGNCSLESVFGVAVFGMAPAV